jgi:hypothetical protein
MMGNKANIRRGEKEIKGREVKIKSRDFWVNIVDFLQQYWAVIEQNEDGNDVTVYFLHEGSGIFASMSFESGEIAQKALLQNGFKNYNDPFENFREYLQPPKAPYHYIKKQGRSMAS